MCHGWADMLIAPRNTINYYTSIVRASGGAAKVSDSIRLFMVPGMGHCAQRHPRAGPGAIERAQQQQRRLSAQRR